MERVVGIGGFFFRANDPSALRRWCEEHLGVTATPTDYHHHPWTQQAGPTVFEPFPIDTSFFGRPDQMWMIDFRVRNLEAIAADSIDLNVSPDWEFHAGIGFSRGPTLVKFIIGRRFHR